MKITLISHSTPAIPTEGLHTIKDLITFAARVSNPANQKNSETADKLIEYLINNKHWSPFEMASACIEIETTRDIARQILRHRSFSFQEFSQRYANPKEFGDQFITREARMQDKSNRQSSTPADDTELEREWKLQQLGVIDSARAAYDWAIDHGIAKEQARCVLPEGNTKSRLYMNGTIRSWIHYIELRSDNGTQREHRDIAVEIGKVISEIFPLTAEETDETA